MSPTMGVTRADTSASTDCSRVRAASIMRGDASSASTVACGSARASCAATSPVPLARSSARRAPGATAIAAAMARRFHPASIPSENSRVNAS